MCIRDRYKTWSFCSKRGMEDTKILLSFPAPTGCRNAVCYTTHSAYASGIQRWICSTTSLALVARRTSSVSFWQESIRHREISLRVRRSALGLTLKCRSPRPVSYTHLKKESIQKALHRLGLLHYFSFIMDADEAGAAKTNQMCIRDRYPD